MRKFGFRAIMETVRKISVSRGVIITELRSRIIETATELFKIRGLQFTMQEIAAALRISKKTIYTVYASKDELLIDMIDGLFADIHSVKARLAASGAPVEERIKAVISALPEQYAAIDFRMMPALEEKYPAAARRVKEHLETNWEPTVALIEEGVAAGRIRPVSIPVLKQMITASVERFLSGDGNGGGYAETLEAMADIIVNGLII
ncbi:MAG: TetR/AcrR family transcriptional regulator [Muribaculaceae bacterium]|nr:TetR/AcrR family transcriptional regulator [Muribaculaceae bacterium]